MQSKKPLLIIFLTVFVDLLGFGIVLPLLPRYADRLQANDVEIGLLMASFSAMQFLFAPLWGRLSDQIGRRPVLILGLSGSVVFYALFGYGSAAESLTILFISRIGAGIAGATISTAQAYIADSTPPEKRTGGMALIGAAFGIGFTFGPLLGAFVLVFRDPNAALSPLPGYLASGISMVALLLAIFVLPESLKPGSRVHDRHWLAWDHFRKVASIPTVASLIVVSFIAVFAFAKFESTLARLTKDVFSMKDKNNFYLFAYTGLSLMLAQGLIVRRLAKVVEDKKLAFGGMAVMLVGMLGLVLGLEASAFWILMVDLPILVLGFSLITTSVQSMISKRTDARDQGQVLGTNQAASSMARILGPVVGNVLYGRGYSLPFVVSAVLVVGASLLLVRVPPEHES